MDSDNISFGAKLEQDRCKVEVVSEPSSGDNWATEQTNEPVISTGSNLFNERAVFVPQNTGSWQVYYCFRLSLTVTIGPATLSHRLFKFQRPGRHGGERLVESASRRRT